MMASRFSPLATLFWFWLRRTLPLLAGIALLIFGIQLAICGVVHDNDQVKAFLQMLDFMPAFVKSMLGGEALQVGNTDALIGMGYRHPMVMMLFMIYVVTVPTGLLAGEVQRGGMELILGGRVTKQQAYLCALAITIIGLVALTLAMFLGTIAGTSIFGFSSEVALGKFLKTAVNGGLLAGAVGGIALVASAWFHRRSSAIAVTAAILLTQYFVWLFAGWWDAVRPYGPATLFHYVDVIAIFRDNEWPVEGMAVLATFSMVSALLGAVVWQRRDLRM